MYKCSNCKTEETRPRDMVCSKCKIGQLEAMALIKFKPVPTRETSYGILYDPPVVGKQLAEQLIVSNDWPNCEIDLTACRPDILISSLFNVFFQTIYDNQGDAALQQARNITWKVSHTFQYSNIYRWSKEFKPEIKIAQRDQNKFEVDDFVAYDIDGKVKGTGTILGIASEGMVDTYIVKLTSMIPGSKNKAITIPSTLLTKINLKD